MPGEYILLTTRISAKIKLTTNQHIEKRCQPLWVANHMNLRCQLYEITALDVHGTAIWYERA